MFTYFGALLALFTLVSGFPEKRLIAGRSHIQNHTYDELVYYFQYASSGYSPQCASPNGNFLVRMYDENSTDTQGFLVRDDTKEEIVVVLRGSSSVQDLATDGDTALVDLDFPGVNPPPGVQAHRGFHEAWKSIATEVISDVQDQLELFPTYSIVTSGHSLGGSLSSMAGVTLRRNFPHVPLRMYTYGQPRTGNSAYATFVDDLFSGDSHGIYRSVHCNDGVPGIVPQSMGYAHHGAEYYQNTDPSRAEVIRACKARGEDMTCSASIPSQGINMAHLKYFDIPVGTPFCG